ncbi:hypothetical protein [Thermococcus sp.]
MNLREFLHRMSLPFRFLVEFHRGFQLNYVRGLQWEEEELENILALILFGSYIGLPHPPVELTYRLLPHMLREIYVMQEKSLERPGIKTGWIGI